ncbi:class II fructose-bisphosphate aldolase [Primorskyibacter sp. S187A]|uniref:class II fructose-bisphosphate aldolase n=1 Tax=Primorskyibacter sp. S187A TaxID=3415130 RepID=UPI003C7ABC6D
MPLVSLTDVLEPAQREGFAVAGLVCLGWEDMRAYVAAAEAEGVPVILQAGPGCRAHTPLPVLGAMFRYLAKGASVPVVAHLDHGYTIEECREAIASGFTSVMFDGSKLPLDDNIKATREIVEMAHAAGVSCEGEIGFVGYSEGAASQSTDPAEAQRFARETGVDAMAISVGNVHLQTQAGDGLDEPAIRAIEAMTDVALVIHGGSGVPKAQRRRLAQGSNICKFNIGTELRRAFGHALRASVATDTDRFDRNAILSDVHDPMVTATRDVLADFKPA